MDALGCQDAVSLIVKSPVFDKGTKSTRNATARQILRRNKTTVGRNRAEVLDQGKKQQKKDQKSSGAGWIIWFIVTLAILLPKLWDFLADWIGTNL